MEKINKLSQKRDVKSNPYVDNTISTKEDEAIKLIKFYIKLDKAIQTLESKKVPLLYGADDYDDIENNNYRNNMARRANKDLDDKLAVYHKVEARPYYLRVIIKNDINQKVTTLLFNESVTDQTEVVDENGKRLLISPFNEAWFELNLQSTQNANTSEIIDGVSHTILLKRLVDIQQKRVESAGDLVNYWDPNANARVAADEYLYRILKYKKQLGRLTNIITSITNDQSKIVAKDLRSNLIVQGCAGCGKTVVLFHRVKHAILKNIGNKQSISIITPSERFNEFVKPLIEDLKIDGIKVLTVSKFYLNSLKNCLIDYSNPDDNYVDFENLLKNAQNFTYVDETIDNIRKTLNADDWTLITNLCKKFKNINEFNQTVKVLKKIRSIEQSINKTFLTNINPSFAFNEQNLDELFKLINNNKKVNKQIGIVQNYILKEKIKPSLISPKTTASNSKKIKTCLKNLESLQKIIKNYSDIFCLYFDETKNKIIDVKISAWIRLIIKSKIDLEKIRNLDLAKCSTLKFWETQTKQYYTAKRLLDIISSYKLESDEEMPQDVVEYFYSNKFLSDVEELNSVFLYPCLKNDLKKHHIFDAIFKSNNFYKKIFGKIKKSNKIKQSIVFDKDTNEMIENKMLWDFLPKYAKKKNVIHKCEIFAILVLALKSRMGSDFKIANASFVKDSILMIDEAQDLSPAEYDVINMLKSDGTVLNLFGDTGQTITNYGTHSWLDVNVEINKDDTVPLNRNYRNPSKIVDFIKQDCSIEMDKLTLPDEQDVKFISKNELQKMIINNSNSGKQVLICSKQNISDYQSKLKQTGILILTPMESKGMEFNIVYVDRDGLSKNEKYIAYSRVLELLNVIK